MDFQLARAERFSALIEGSRLSLSRDVDATLATFGVQGPDLGHDKLFHSPFVSDF